MDYFDLCMEETVNFVHVPENFSLIVVRKECVKAIIQLRHNNPRDIIVYHQGMHLTFRDLYLALGEQGEWINDQIMNFYFKLIQERNVREGLQAVYVFDTFFYTSLEQFGVEKSTVKTSTMKPVFDHTLALMPCHLKYLNHWALIGINFIKKTITVYDSKYSYPSADGILVKRFLLSHIDKLGLRERFPDFLLRLPLGIPKQRNNADCGVYVMVYAEYLARNVHPTHIPHEAPFYRSKIFLELLARKITHRE